MARRPEHDPVAGRLAEPGVGSAIALADVGLDLDDPADPAAGRVVADQAGADERAARLERRAGQAAPLEDAQLAG
jgi:hypothetical protein